MKGPCPRHIRLGRPANHSYENYNFSRSSNGKEAMVEDTKAPLGQVQEPIIITATNIPAIKEPVITITAGNQVTQEPAQDHSNKDPEPGGQFNKDCLISSKPKAAQ